MAKPTFTFHFEDEPQFKTTCDRAWLASYLRAARKQKYLQVVRLGKHLYNVTLNGCTAKAIISVA